MAGDVIAGGDLMVSAAGLRKAAEEADGRGDALLAERYRLAAWGQEFSATALRGEMDGMKAAEAAKALRPDNG
jgi:hypothetical protein